jgi:hypothetical protein
MNFKFTAQELADMASTFVEEQYGRRTGDAVFWDTLASDLTKHTMELTDAGPLPDEPDEPDEADWMGVIHPLKVGPDLTISLRDAPPEVLKHLGLENLDERGTLLFVRVPGANRPAQLLSLHAYGERMRQAAEEDEP